MYESERDNGITHFLEHVAIRNINKLTGGELYSLLDKQGIEFNASTYSEMVQFYTSGATESFRTGADIITKVFSPIILDKSEIDTERKRIKAEIREADDKNSLLVFSNGIVHAGTSLSRSITGTLTGVDKITAKRLEEYRKSVFTKENVFFYVTGNYTDGDIEYLASLVEKYSLSESSEKHENIAPVSKNHFRRPSEAYVKNADFTSVRFTFDVDMKKVSTPETDLIYDMLLSGYGSRFFVEMSEERGLFYDLTGAVERYKNIGEFCFSYELRQKDLGDALKLTVEILNDFKKTLHAPDSLMKSGYVNNAYMLYDDARELNFTFAYDNHIMELGYPSLEERKRAYAEVTPEDIRRAACEIFKPENLTLTVKGNKKKIDTEEIKGIISSLL
jgi:predicted Zn-dependent peptidase